MGIISPRSFWLPVFVTTLVVALFGSLLERGEHDHGRLLVEQARVERELEILREENRRLQTERHELLSQLSAVERAAREELGLKAPGETVMPAAEGYAPSQKRQIGVSVTPDTPSAGRLLGQPQLAWRLTLVALAASALFFLGLNLAVAAWRYGAPSACESPGQEISASGREASATGDQRRHAA